MAYVTRTEVIGTDWTLVTANVAMIQFNRDMHMLLNAGTTPTDTVGFSMTAGEKYINNSAAITVWAKVVSNISDGIDSVRIAEDV